jgi:hypothetical protein
MHANEVSFDLELQCPHLSALVRGDIPGFLLSLAKVLVKSAQQG